MQPRMLIHVAESADVTESANRVFVLLFRPGAETNVAETEASVGKKEFRARKVSRRFRGQVIEGWEMFRCIRPYGGRRSAVGSKAGSGGAMVRE